ncbi:hypothetical protein KJ966_19950 [bacterium]|nr:hypothetical protein [bacterium]
MLCIASAVFQEVKPLIELTNASRETGNRWFDKTRNLLIAATGVGFLESAIQLNRLLQETPSIEKIIFTGSAGVYPGCRHIRIGDLCICTDTILCDGAAELGLSAYVPLADQGPIKASLSLSSSLSSARVATIFSITTDNDLAGKIGENRKADIENMELYGIARVCLEGEIPWNALLGVTNTVGKKGRTQWNQNRNKLAEKACNHLFKLVIKNISQPGRSKV